MPRRTLKKLRATLRAAASARNLRRRLGRGDTPRIVVGSGGISSPEWIPTDIDYLNLLQPSDWLRFFAPNTIAAILAEHVWEHLSPEEGRRAARLCFEFLRPGGYLRIAIPDGYHPDPDYLQWVRPGGTGPGAADHKILYNYKSLEQMLTDAGFEVRLLEYFDETGQFRAIDWNPAEGMIRRSRRFDERNRDGRLRYTSLIADAQKILPVEPRPPPSVSS